MNFQTCLRPCNKKAYNGLPDSAKEDKKTHYLNMKFLFEQGTALIKPVLTGDPLCNIKWPTWFSWFVEAKEDEYEQ